MDPEELGVLPSYIGLPGNGWPYDGVRLVFTGPACECRPGLLRGGEFTTGGCRQPVKPTIVSTDRSMPSGVRES